MTKFTDAMLWLSYAIGCALFTVHYAGWVVHDIGFVGWDHFGKEAWFLFVAVIPLVFAPETLPEKKMELRRLRSFAEEAKRAKEKFERKK